MALVGFICPRDKKNYSFEYCLGVCGKCDELPFLYAITKDLREIKTSVFSVTEILKPQLQVRLNRTQCYYVKPENLTAAAFGTALHMLIASGRPDLHNAGFLEYEFESALHFEEKISTDYGPAILIGTPDQYNYNTNILIDYKSLKYFYDGRALREGKIMEQSTLRKYVYQINIYRRYKFPECRGMKIFALYKDFNNTLRESGVPAYELHNVPQISDDEIDSLVKLRLNLHMAAQNGQPCEPCTEDERFFQPNSGASLACLLYCSVRDICPIRSQYVNFNSDGSVFIPQKNYKTKPRIDRKGSKDATSVHRSSSGISKKI